MQCPLNAQCVQFSVLCLPSFTEVGSFKWLEVISEQDRVWYFQLYKYTGLLCIQLRPHHADPDKVYSRSHSTCDFYSKWPSTLSSALILWDPAGVQSVGQVGTPASTQESPHVRGLRLLRSSRPSCIWNYQGHSWGKGKVLHSLRGGVNGVTIPRLL